MCTGKIRLLCQLGTEKIAFIYFYISAFCSLTNRPTDKQLMNRSSYVIGMCTEKIRLTLIVEKLPF